MKDGEELLAGTDANVGAEQVQERAEVSEGPLRSREYDGEQQPGKLSRQGAAVIKLLIILQNYAYCSTYSRAVYEQDLSNLISLEQNAFTRDLDESKLLSNKSNS